MDRSVSKTVSIPNQGTTRTPDFVPADFGWHSWPSGKFWFDVEVPLQGKMASASNHAGVNDARENFVVPVDPEVTKTIYSGGADGSPVDVVNDREVFASGMWYEARISGNVNGYASRVTLRDTIRTDQVFIGSKTEDIASQVYVTDPSGNRVEGATISIDRSQSGRVVVSGSVDNIPNANQSRVYTLHVPTYFLPTQADYTVEDDSSICYTRDVDECLEGNSETVRKVTPAPDKVWAIDEAGALTAYDPDWTNEQGADEKVFLSNDGVSAVVNGRIPANLAEPFSNYEIADDWSDAAPFIDFTDASRAKVFLETTPGSGQYTDVTSQFDVTVADGETRAKAKAGSQFLLNSKNSSSVDRKVKLVISGTFKPSADWPADRVVETPEGTYEPVLIPMINGGEEVWNNETMPTNEPPVYTWVPVPEKDVVGDSRESGDNADASVNGMQVFPGQHLKYTIDIDLRIPSNTAHGVKSLSVLDEYDPNFVPERDSVTFWDSREQNRPVKVPRSAYKLTFDEAAHSWRADFTDEWVAANVNAQGANSEWAGGRGWLSVEFSGKVSDTIAGGETVRNKAFQIINNDPVATSEPVVEIPVIDPEKEVVNVFTLDDIDGKTVVEGDHLLYRLTLDAKVKKEDLAYNVHKLGMLDDYDEKFLDLTAEGVTVKRKTDGADFTDAFNVQVKDGKVWVFAKTIDTVNAYGETIPGDPQPKDLEAYANAPIRPHEDPMIDQELLGHEYYILLDTVVNQEVDGYVIYNQATQNIQNTWHETQIVSNPIKDIDPDKDVVVSEETKGDSINEAEVKLFSDFNYRLNSSEIPANRAYDVRDWSMTDTFDRVHDEFTGVWAIYANNDVYDGDELVFKKGDLLQDSAGHESEPWNGLFDVSFDESTYTLTAKANQKYIDLVNTRGDLEQSFSVYTKMIRIAPSEKVENKVDETYNEFDRESNIVWTSTPEHPAIQVEKYTLHEGWEQGAKGDRDDVKLAYELARENLVASTSEEGETPAEGEEGKKPLDIGFFVENKGDVPLVDVKVADATLEGTYGNVENILCEVPEGYGQQTPEELKAEAKKQARGELEEAGETKSTWVALDQLSVLKVGERIDCVGQLFDVQPGQTHSDEVTATGKSVFTGEEVSDKDQWHAVAPSDPAVDIIKYTLDEGQEKGDRNEYKDALVLTPEQAKNGLKIGFDITNTGDEPLKDLDFSDVTNDATTGKVEDIRWAVPVEEKAAEAPVAEAPAEEEAATEAPAEEVAAEEAAAPAETVELDGVTYELRSLDDLKKHVLAPGETITLIGTLRGVEAGTGHQNEASIEGTAVYSGKKVGDDDPWNAKFPSKDVPNPPCDCGNPDKGAVTGEMDGIGGPGMLVGGIALLLLVAAATAVYLVSRNRRAAQLTAAGQDELPME